MKIDENVIRWKCLKYSFIRNDNVQNQINSFQLWKITCFGGMMVFRWYLFGHAEFICGQPKWTKNTHSVTSHPINRYRLFGLNWILWQCHFPISMFNFLVRVICPRYIILMTVEFALNVDKYKTRTIIVWRADIIDVWMEFYRIILIALHIT